MVWGKNFIVSLLFLDPLQVHTAASSLRCVSTFSIKILRKAWKLVLGVPSLIGCNSIVQLHVVENFLINLLHCNLEVSQQKKKI